MGDIWPYGHLPRLGWDAIHYQVSTITGVTPDPNIFAAIALAESGGDPSVINDTPSTGDYSVGLWQINYNDGLYAGRAAEFGTPQQLVQGGLPKQADVAVRLWRQQGYNAWTTYTSGAYRQYLGPGGPTGSGQTPGQQTAPVVTDISPDTWSDSVRQSKDHFYLMTLSAYNYTVLISGI